MTPGDPCPVCNHPTGDCVGDSVQPVTSLFAGEWNSAPGKEPQVLLEEDVWVEAQMPGGVAVRKLAAKAGTTVSAARARRLGVLT